MPAQRDRPKDPGGETAEALTLRLREAVSAGVSVKANGGGPDRRNGSGPIALPGAREIAIDVCSAILAETSAGTAEHSSDVVLITEAIGERMGIEGEQAGDLLAAARLHDIGKAWVPGRILEKPGPLSDGEWAIMRQHTLVGERILSSVDELREVARLVRHSHERWDGGGYPDRLAGSEIPLGSRIIFCADSFHAIRSDRPYRSGRSAREAVAEINRCAGTQFDPQVAGALEQVVRERNRRPRGSGGSSRLFALLMCLVIGGAGTAIARSGLLAEPAGTAPPASAPKPPPACGAAACPTVAGPVGGLTAVGALSGAPGPRPLHPGLPGQIHKRGHGKRGAGKSSGTHGKSAAAKQRHAEKSKGKHAGHSVGSHGNSEAAHSRSTAAPSSSSGGSGGGSSHSSGGHHSSASHSSGHGASSHAHSGGGGVSSNGNAGGNGNGNGHG